MQLPDTLESRWIEVNGRTIHYVAPACPVERALPIVLVHGVGLSHRYMIPTAERLIGEFPVYVPDLPGFGMSYKPWRTLTIPELADRLANWMAAIGLPAAGLLGNSVGCQIIVHLAVRHPERVGCAVLQGPTVDPVARTFRQQLARWRENRQTETRRDKGPIVIRDYWECGPWRLARTFQHAMDDPIEQWLPRMHCPTLVVRGELDPIVPQPWAEEVARRLPNGRLVILGGKVSHTANFEAPDELVEATRPFFREHQ